MTTLAFDTYAFIRKLKESGITEEQARTQVEALSLAFEQFQSDQSAGSGLARKTPEGARAGIARAELHLSESATK